MEETAQGSTHPRSIYLRKCNRFNDIEHCRKQVVGPLRVSERWLNLPRKPEKPRDIEPQPTTQRSKPRPLECYIDKTVHDLRSSSSFHLQCREDNVINLGVQGARPACWCEHFGVAPRRSQHTVVQQAFCSLSKGVTPRIVQENSLYWLVFKPRGWECSALLLDHTGVGVPSCRSKSNITELNLEPDKEILLKHPVLFSKRHNYGVVLHLEKEWSGITIIAKSEESYHQLLDLLENGLIKCQLSFLVERSQQTKISQIEGKTRFGDSRLKINILQCVDLANLNKVPPTYKSPKQPKSSKVCTQSRIFVEIDFPPILMEEIFTANGLRIVQNTDLENAAVNSDASSACCCYCVTLVEPRPGESSHLTSTLRKIRVESQNALFRASNNSTSSGPNKLNIQISDWASQIADCLRRNALMKHYNSRLLYRLAICGALGCASSLLWASCIFPLYKVASAELMNGIGKEATMFGRIQPAQIFKQLLPCPSLGAINALRLCCDPFKGSTIWRSTKLFCPIEPHEVEFLFGDAEAAIWKQQLN